MCEKEIWRDVKGYEGLYKVSNTGKVLSKARNKVLKPSTNSKGYLRVTLSGKKRVFVHRLVALHFVKNPDEKTNTIVNHLDCDPLNNNADNLEWTTMAGNTQYAVKIGRMDRTSEWLDRLHRSQARTYKAVEAYDPCTGEVIESFDSVNHVKRKGYEPSSVCMCCQGKRSKHKGLKWRYTGGESDGNAI